MDNHSRENENDAHSSWSFFAGLLVGSLAGAGAMLLVAPQSGKKTRSQIERKSIELRDQTTEGVEDAVTQAGVKARQISVDVHEQAEALQHRGQDMLDDQRKRLSTVIEAGKTAVQNVRTG
jgi:gas vesicle protein